MHVYIYLQDASEKGNKEDFLKKNLEYMKGVVTFDPEVEQTGFVTIHQRIFCLLLSTGIKEEKICRQEVHNYIEQFSTPCAE